MLASLDCLAPGRFRHRCISQRCQELLVLVGPKHRVKGRRSDLCRLWELASEVRLDATPEHRHVRIIFERADSHEVMQKALPQHQGPIWIAPGLHVADLDFLLSPFLLACDFTDRAAWLWLLVESNS